MRTFTVMLVPDDSTAPMRRVHISRWLVNFVVAGFLCLLIAIGFFTLDYVDLQIKNQDYDRIVAESEGLRGETKILETNLNEVKESLHQVREYTKKLNEMTAMSIKAVATKTNAKYLAEEHKTSRAEKRKPVITGIPVGLSLEKLDFKSVLNTTADVKEEAIFQATELKSLIATLSQRQSLLDSVPTINPVDGWIASGFGRRISPFTGKLARHEGLDVAAPIGTPIYAPADGVVVFAGKKPGFGNFIMIAHGYGIVTRYGHCNEILVNLGQRIDRGEKLGTVGMTGRTTGPHLHYEIVVNGKTVNPRRFILQGERQLYTMAH